MILRADSKATEHVRSGHVQACHKEVVTDQSVAADRAPPVLARVSSVEAGESHHASRQGLVTQPLQSLYVLFLDEIASNLCQLKRRRWPRESLTKTSLV